MKLLALEKELPGATPEAFQPLLKSEAWRIWELQQSGTLRETYFRADQHSAVLVLECGNIEEARQLLSTLPLVNAGLIAFEIIPLAPYDGLSRLFDKGPNPSPDKGDASNG
jgi:muconolactone delta-isomerase